MMNFLMLCLFLHNEVLFDVVTYFFDAMAYVLMLWRTCSHNEVLFDVMEYFLCHGVPIVVLFDVMAYFLFYGVLFDVMAYFLMLCCTF